MKQNFFDDIDNDWDDLVSNVYNDYKDNITIEPELINNIYRVDKSVISNYDLTNAKHILFANGVELIESMVFQSYDYKILPNVKTIIFPSSLKTIGTFAFFKTDVESVEFNGNVEIINSYAFHKCKNLKTIIFNGNIKHIKGMAFDDCDITGELKFPDNLIDIGICAFDNNKNITKVIFPDGLEKIDYNAFGNCTGITGDVIIPESVNEINHAAFNKCNNIKRIFINKEKHDGWHEWSKIYCNAKVVYY